jgi:hypothetical protein
VNTYNRVFGDMSNNCDKLCPLECDSISYLITTTMSDFPSDSYVNMLLNTSLIKSVRPNISAYELKSNLVSFRLFYSSLEYTEITQSPQMEFFDLLSSIGGSMGNYMI